MFFSFQISIFPLGFPGIQGPNGIPVMLGIPGVPEPQGQQGKDGLRESLVSRDRGDRCAPGMMGLKGDKGNEGSRGKCFRNSLRWSIYIIS